MTSKETLFRNILLVNIIPLLKSPYAYPPPPHLHLQQDRWLGRILHRAWCEPCCPASGSSHQRWSGRWSVCSLAPLSTRPDNSLVHSHWSRNVEAGLSLVRASKCWNIFTVLLHTPPALLCHKEPAHVQGMQNTPNGRYPFVGSLWHYCNGGILHA